MYTFFFVLFCVLISIFILIFAIILRDGYGDSDAFGPLIAAVIFGLILWFQIECVPVREGIPTLIPKSEYSVMYDDNIAIINYHDILYKFEKVSEYNKIVSRQFIVTETIGYNILDEDCGKDIEIKFKP